jgi:hypothetical protein
MSTTQTCPSCGSEMEKKNRRRMSDEQKWCGEWWNCLCRNGKQCNSTVLIPSQELESFLTKQALVSDRGRSP